MAKFKNVISIGDNCEVGANLARFGINEGDLLRYALSDLTAICNLFENDFKGLFDEVYCGIDGKLVFCKRYNIGFHTKFTLKEFEGKYTFGLTGESFLAEYYIEKSKIDYLVTKLKNTLLGQSPLLFIYKSSKLLNYDQLKVFSEILSSKFPKLEYKILTLKAKSQDVIGLPIREILTEELEFIAPDSNTITGGDWSGWARALDNHTPILDEKIGALARYLKPQESLAALVRDLALILENGGDIPSALWTMKKAQMLSPSGFIIKSKIEEYEKKILNEDKIK